MSDNINRSTETPRIFIPDVLANWPWARKIHPDYVEIEKETATWLAGFEMFDPEAQEAFNRGGFSLFACLFYPNLRKESMRCANDLQHLFFMFDEYSDKSTPSEVCRQQDIFLDAFHNPNVPRPKGEWVGGEMARQFWQINMQNTTEVFQKKFVQYTIEFFEGVKQESIDRQDCHIHDIGTYLEQRFRTGGVMAVFYLLELELDLPDEVMKHAAIQEIVQLAGEIAILSNDIVSYNVEQMRGDEFHNIIACVMKEHGTDVNGAMLWVQDRISGLIEKFLTAMASLPRWEEPLNSDVRKYCDGLGQMVRGNWEWSFESERYLGNKGAEVKKTKWMSLLPKKLGVNEIGPAHVDSSLL